MSENDMKWDVSDIDIDVTRSIHFDIRADSTTIIQLDNSLSYFLLPSEIESCVQSFVECRIKIYSLILSAHVWDVAGDLFTNGFIKTCFSRGH